MELIEEGSITSVVGFKAAGITAGLKKSGKKDLALLVSDTPALSYVMVTQNRFRAAPVILCETYQAQSPFKRALVINSGNANAGTGEEGMKNAITMAEKTAALIGVDKNEVFVASTGVIGEQLPIEKIEKGLATIIPRLSATGGVEAAEAIRTTDTFTKSCAVTITIEGVPVTIGGMAKGSGMIHPNMATMIGAVTTDVNITPEILEELFKASILYSYNMISVDGDTSTNDAAFLFCNQRAEHSLIDSKTHPGYQSFKEALDYVQQTLAKMIAKDGEGATKMIEATIEGAKNSEDARAAAKAIITSSLVKTAIFGEDGNWGRILSSVGNSSAEFSPENVKAWISSSKGSVQIVEKGRGILEDEVLLANILKANTIIIRLHLGEGDSRATAWGCDLSYDYVRINAEYRT